MKNKDIWMCEKEKQIWVHSRQETPKFPISIFGQYIYSQPPKLQIDFYGKKISKMSSNSDQESLQLDFFFFELLCLISRETISQKRKRPEWYFYCRLSYVRKLWLIFFESCCGHIGLLWRWEWLVKNQLQGWN